MTRARDPRGAYRDEERFIGKRESALRAWRFAGPLALVVVVALAVWLWFTAPLLIDPFTVLTCLFVLVVALVLAFVVAANERRYLRIIRRRDEDDDSGKR